jgi:MOSC domain-containing protein YiiM
MSIIATIMYKPVGVEDKPEDHFSRVTLAEAKLIQGYGIEGDQNAGAINRDLNIIASETLTRLKERGFKTNPGEMGEQITTMGVNVEGLNPGDRLFVGDEAIIEVVKNRTGCTRFQRIQGHAPSEAVGQLGVMARVVQGGMIRAGDAVRLEPGVSVA